jgi:hypothetical protein
VMITSPTSRRITFSSSLPRQNRKAQREKISRTKKKEIKQMRKKAASYRSHTSRWRRGAPSAASA